MWVHFLDAIEVFHINLFNPGNKVVRCIKSLLESTYGSSLGNAAHMAAFMSKKGPMERGIHRATRRKDSTASDILDMIRLAQ